MEAVLGSGEIGCDRLVTSSATSVVSLAPMGSRFDASMPGPSWERGDGAKDSSPVHIES